MREIVERIPMFENPSGASRRGSDFESIRGLLEEILVNVEKTCHPDPRQRVVSLRKSIHFILPGGGVKGCFQAGFLYRLWTAYQGRFTIYRIDGTSVGSLNGLALATHRLEKLKEMWLGIRSMSDLFSNTSRWQLGALVNGFYSRGIYDNSNLLHKISTYEDLRDGDYPDLEKFNCVVMDIDEGRSYYINGTNTRIRDFVLASSSPLIITQPQSIDGHLYTDGGLLENFPIEYCANSNADLQVMVGYDAIYENLRSEIGNNIFTYLQSLIDITRREHYHQVIQRIHQLGLIVIPYGVQTDFINFHPDVIRNGLMIGELAADDFASKYL